MSDGSNQNAGDGNGGDQNQNAGDSNQNTGDRNSGSNTNDKAPMELTTEHVNSIIDVASQKLGGQFVSKNDFETFKTDISKEITGAVRRMTDDLSRKNNADADNKNQDNNSNTADILSASVTIDGNKMSVADLAKGFQDAKKLQAEIAEKEAAQRHQQLMLTIKTGLQERNVIPQTIDLIADGIAARVKTDNGDFVIENVKVPNPLHNNDSDPKTINKTMKLNEFLDFQVSNNKNLVSNTFRDGSGGGNDGGDNKNTGEKFTAEKALKDPNLYEEWMTKDPDACQRAMDEYTAKL